MSCVVAGKIYKDDEKLRTFDPASKLTNENIIVTITSVIYCSLKLLDVLKRMHDIVSFFDSNQV